ncbi:lectin-like domain-containing protein [Lactococcus kimchii]|uniref:lectin-like domain-containing protein n=1 Tax=Lactococcus sp. S-13 TaxID=2507158 RepID=UPI0010237F9E|nr:hypothetical protein [Lactococcus sp. S-13]RZI48968.1 hypothetical protein EQJ87_05655 [Lactococcus sp. S-13]
MKGLKRQFANQRKLAKGFLTLFLSAILLVGVLWSVGQAKVLATTLVPGQSLNVGDETYNSTQLQDEKNWTSLGSVTDFSAAPFGLTLVKNQGQEAGYSFFNGKLDFSQSIRLSGTFVAQVSSNNPFSPANAMEVGDALGFILTPSSNQLVENNLPHATAGQLGIGGLPYSVFLGRDFYHNSEFDEEGGNGASDYISLRRTDENGQLLTRDYPSLSVPDPGILTSQGLETTNRLTDVMTLTWTPEQVSADGQSISGKLTYTVSSATAASQTLSENLTVAQSMTLGVVGVTGGHYGLLTYSTAGGSLLATKAKQAVQVNYLDETGQKIQTSSTLFAPAGAELSVGAEEDTAAGSYQFAAPMIPNYVFDKSAPIRVSDLSENQINVYYKKRATASFSYKYASNTPDQSPSLPDMFSVSAAADGKIPMPDLPQLPPAYYVSAVVDANGQTYPTVAAALAALKNGESANYSLLISAKNTQVTFQEKSITGLLSTKKWAALAGSMYEIPVMATATDVKGNSYEAVVKVVKKAWDGSISSSSSATDSTLEKQVSEHLLTGKYDSAELSISVSYVKVKNAPTSSDPLDEGTKPSTPPKDSENASVVDDGKKTSSITSAGSNSPSQSETPPSREFDQNIAPTSKQDSAASKVATDNKNAEQGILKAPVAPPTAPFSSAAPNKVARSEVKKALSSTHDLQVRAAVTAGVVTGGLASYGVLHCLQKFARATKKIKK